MSIKGYDYFTYEPNTTNEVRCAVCGTICEVTRNTFGPTSFASAMAGSFRHHDSFACPHASEQWHEQALRLVLAIEETPSKRVAELMKLDLSELLETFKAQADRARGNEE
jgi:hypothetical protein